MNFLNKLFQSEGANEPGTQWNWVDLYSSDQLDILNDNSYHHLQVVFKHSTSCGISGMVKRSFQKAPSHPEKGVTYYLLDLLRHREISNSISEKYGVRHESPQVLLIREGEVVAHASHHSITSIDLNEWV